MTKPKISLLCPSRNRPDKMRKTIVKWRENCADIDEVQVILSVDRDDDHLGAYHEIHDLFTDGIVVGPNKTAIEAINLAAGVSKGNIMIVVSDDTECFDGWDQAILKVVEGKEDFILKCSDGGTQSWIITMPVMDRKYYKRFGYVYNPSYQHMFADTEITAVADLLGRKLICDLEFKHLHYSVTGTAKDAVSEKADATWDQGKALFLERYKNNFGLIDPPGKITSEEYLNWIAGEI